jgi:P pilus assembly chaperone PapD
VNKHFLRTLFASVVASTMLWAQAGTGILPEVAALRVSEEDGQAQMALKNVDTVPLLLHTQVQNIPEDNSLTLIPLPPIVRVEPNTNQIVRFILEKPAKPLEVQHFKRVTFEGIPPAGPKVAGQIKLNVRYDLPVLISPKGLVQHEAPWELLTWKLSGTQLTVSNPSKFVVRLQRDVDLMPGAKRFEALKKTYVLPGESFTAELPAGVKPETVQGLRMFPVSLYGAAMQGVDAPVSR